MKLELWFAILNIHTLITYMLFLCQLILKVKLDGVTSDNDVLRNSEVLHI